MSRSFAVIMARREGRSSRRRIGLYMGSITLGVAALVAINAFRADLSRAIQLESRQLLGADLELRSRRPFPDEVRRVLDSAVADGASMSWITSFSSMALAPHSGRTRLVQVRAVLGDYPYYGNIETDPAGRWPDLHAGRFALVDHALLIQLEADIGDSLRIGESTFVIRGALRRVPGEIALRAAVGPRVYLSGAYLDETGLLRFGSRARYAAYLRLPFEDQVQPFLNGYAPLFRTHRISSDTVSDRRRSLSDSLDLLARFLGLVGLTALLLGGVGVASAVHVFVKSKLSTVAVLRCLGARQRTVFSAYLMQAALLGAAGAALGTVLGAAVQANLPTLLGDFLPLDVETRLSWTTMAAGLAIGTATAVLFGLLPLLAVRRVSPLVALRREYEPAGRRDPYRWGAIALIVAGVVAVSIWQAPTGPLGLAYAAAIGATAGVLWTAAWLLIRATRRLFPRHAPYVLRQGIANLFRPHNQTVPVTLAVGFGVFLIGTVHVVQRSLLDQISIESDPERPNLVVFDVQLDQQPGVEAMLAERGIGAFQRAPIVPSRIAAINGRSVDELLGDTTGPAPSRWAVTREYRTTYRDSTVRTETVTAGRWWTGPPPAGEAAVPRVSLEEDVARELRVDVGDHIEWDIQGVRIETRVASLRRVDWARFELNFFVVAEPGVLEAAPQHFVTMLRIDDDRSRAELQRDLVTRYSNVSSVDLALVQRTLDTIFRSVAVAVRFMALFSIASGVIVLIGAIATSRYQRLLESVLLKTLGARSRQVRAVLCTEYAALGALAGLVGSGLAAAAGWICATQLFEVTYRAAPLALSALASGAVLLTTAIGLWSSRDVFRRAPLAVMREMGE